MNERDETRLLFIKDGAELLLEMIEGCDLQGFLSDERTQLAVSMALITIGEYASRLSDDFKQENQDIKWRSISDLRNIADHNYNGIRMEDIWEIATEDVPELLEQVKGILRDGGVEGGIITRSPVGDAFRKYQ